ncbi:unnamed protein product [Notodromas monacha]|uniref:Metalloendopeptidase n=1 Tax=Notodromas monacha TaxID=399045 RepID=A0A7R9BC49_9CRUS|nr:unnamed protein product [Notodromas monacha]CAG0912504.1 unnamed protein product [Notodromas monacha]
MWRRNRTVRGLLHHSKPVIIRICAIIFISILVAALVLRWMFNAPFCLMEYQVGHPDNSSSGQVCFCNKDKPKKSSNLPWYKCLDQKHNHSSKVVSFVMFGDGGQWVQGLAHNTKRVQELYPGWGVHLYHNIAEPQVCSQLCQVNSQFGNLHLCPMLPNSWLLEVQHMVWRFIPMADPSVTTFISRDLDSVVSSREVAAVAEWLATPNKTLHTMNDHPGHLWPVMGGMWGINFQSHANGTTLTTIRRIMKQLFLRMVDHSSVLLGQGKGVDQVLLLATVAHHFKELGYAGPIEHAMVLEPGCIDKPTVVHELVHLLGFPHEHSRTDRDKYVRVNWKNLRSGWELSFNKHPGRYVTTGPYDYYSLMHYDLYTNAKNERMPTLQPLKPVNLAKVGHGDTLTKTDIQKINKFYFCKKTQRNNGFIMDAPNGMEEPEESIFNPHPVNHGSHITLNQLLR